MPAKSKAQIIHLEKLNFLPQTLLNRYRDGHIPHNKSREPKKNICPICGINEKGVYFSKCKPCSYKIRREAIRERTWGNGYVYKECGNRPRPEHINIAEKVLGRKLKQGENVHHINLDKTDNRHENLIICSVSYHKWLHNKYAIEFARRFLCHQQNQ